MFRTASMLFARSISRECSGKEECHWCGSPCTKQWIHDDSAPIPFQRSTSSALRPSNPYVCVGCWHYRRPSVSVYFLTPGELKDRQTLLQHSWLLTERGVHAIRRPEDVSRLYAFLLSPAKVFCLSLVDSDKDGNARNLIQLAKVNQFEAIAGDTALKYTLNNREYSYTPYELEEALKHGSEGKPGGVHNLIHWLGPYEGIARVDPEEKRESAGRPKKEERERLPGKKLK